jgi:hypothetical protein
LAESNTILRASSNGNILFAQNEFPAMNRNITISDILFYCYKLVFQEISFTSGPFLIFKLNPQIIVGV